MQKPLVSVIVPIYNAQNNIVRCVESIRRQTYENLEILLLNDGSKDVSYPVCEMLSKADARIVLIDKENSGVSATRNLGMRMARGKYLQFVDADDTLEPFATELLVQRAEDNNADLVIAAYNRIVPYKPKKEAKLDPLLPNKKKQLTEQLAKFQTFGFLPMGFMTKEEFACGLMQEPASFYYGVMWNKLYRADLVRAHTDVRCSEEMTWSEDLYFNLTYIRYAERFFALTAPIYNYYDNPGSAVHLTKVRTAITARTALFSYYKELYEQLGLYEENKLQIFKYLIISDIHSFSFHFPAFHRRHKISRNIIYFAVRTSEQWYDVTSKRHIILPPACTKDDKKEQYIFITIYCHDKLLSVQQIVRTRNRSLGLSYEPNVVKTNCLLITLKNKRTSKHQIDK